MISLSRMMLETSLSQTGFSLMAAEPSEIGTLSLDSADLGLNLLTEQPSGPALQKVVDPPAAKVRPLAGHSPSQDHHSEGQQNVHPLRRAVSCQKALLQAPPAVL